MSLLPVKFIIAKLMKLHYTPSSWWLGYIEHVINVKLRRTKNVTNQ